MHYFTTPLLATIEHVSADKYKVSQLSLFGKEYQSEISINDIKPMKSIISPFSNFSVNGKYYYANPSNITDEALKKQIDSMVMENENN